MNLGEYILSTFLSIIGALLVAYASIRMREHIEKEHLKKALLHELEENMFKVKGYIDYLEQLKEKDKKTTHVILPLLSTLAYDEITRRGILYDLPKDIREKIIATYVLTREINVFIGILKTKIIYQNISLPADPKYIDPVIMLSEVILQNIKESYRVLKDHLKII